MREGFKLLAQKEKRSMSAELQVLVEREVFKFQKEMTKV